MESIEYPSRGHRLFDELMVSRGYSNRQIAIAFGAVPSTVGRWREKVKEDARTPEYRFRRKIRELSDGTILEDSWDESDAAKPTAGKTAKAAA